MKAMIFTRVMKAWLVGLLSSGLIVLPLAFTLTTSVPRSLSEKVILFISWIPPALVMTLLGGIFMSLPLLLIAYLVALWCRNLIADNRLLFAILAPLVTAAIVTIYLVLSANDASTNSIGFWSQVEQTYFSWTVWIFASPVLASATYYCFYLKHPTRSD